LRYLSLVYAETKRKAQANTLASPDVSNQRQ